MLATVITSDPRKALPKLSTWKAKPNRVASQEASQNISALMTSMNSPKVTTSRGHYIATAMGRTRAFTKPKMTPTTARVTGFSLYLILGISSAAAHRPTQLISRDHTNLRTGALPFLSSKAEPQGILHADLDESQVAQALF